jgi:hypothetical protein
MRRRSDTPYVWLEAALNLLVGAALLLCGLTTNSWSVGLARVSVFGGGACSGCSALPARGAWWPGTTASDPASGEWGAQGGS